MTGTSVKPVFINYGLFDSNSGGHIAHFANALAARGAEVSVIAHGNPSSAADFGPLGFRAYTYDEIEHDVPPRLTEALQAPGALIHAWTPREGVRRLTERLSELTGCAYLVHLEDNEEVITSSQLGRPWSDLAAEGDDPATFPHHLAHPAASRRFLAGARGVTVITDKLRMFVPRGVPTHVLEPGVDTETFSPDLSAEDRAAGRADLYIEPDATVLAYHGNMHPANRREIFSLYAAVTRLRRRGHDVRLIRTGEDHCDDLDPSMAYLRRAVIDLRVMERGDLIRVLKLADAYVQPGGPNPFNDFRLPSKVPEFLSLGRPVVLPKTNIGLRLRDGVDALLLERGDGLEIADTVERLIGDPNLAARLGANARRFALSHLSWTRSAEGLEAFYARARHGAGSGRDQGDRAA